MKKNVQQNNYNIKCTIPKLIDRKKGRIKRKLCKARNLKYMRKFAEFVNDEKIVQTLSAQLTWSHNVHLFNKTNILDEYIWYVEQTIENGWSYHL